MKVRKEAEPFKVQPHIHGCIERILTPQKKKKKKKRQQSTLLLNSNRKKKSFEHNEKQRKGRMNDETLSDVRFEEGQIKKVK